MKRILALLLAAVMAFSIVPVAVLAASETVEFNGDTYAESSSVTLSGGKNYKLVAGETAIIDESDTWTVGVGSTLFVYGTLEVKGTLKVEGRITCIDDGELIARLTDDCKILNVQNINGNETDQVKRYFAEVQIPSIMPNDELFGNAAHKLVVEYKTSFTGSENDYLKTTYNDGSAYDFKDVYTSEFYDGTTGMLKVPLNQYLFFRFSFLENGAASKKYDGDRMAIRFNRVPALSAQGVCSHYMDGPGAVEYLPAAIASTSGSSFNVWKDSYFLRQERIYIPTGNGYSAYGVKGEISATDQTVRLNYGEEFQFRVNIDKAYSDSVYSVYLVQGYRWNERNYEDLLENLRDEIYIDENGNPQHYVWKFEPAKNGEQQNIYIDENGVYHIAAVEDEYTIVVSGVVSNDTLSMAGGIMDTIRNLINALKQFFERIKQLLGL